MTQKLIKILSRFYPFYFAIFPIIAFYSTNRRELTLGAIYLPIIVFISITAFVWYLLKLVFKGKDDAKIIISLFLVYFFSYQHFSRFTKTFFFYSLIYALVTYAFLRVRQKTNVHIILSILGSYLLIYNLIQVIPFEVKRALSRPKMIPIEISASRAINKDELPDIYYFIFDRYASFSTLSDYYGFDNSDFFNFLLNQDFYVATESAANYPRTHLSLGSSLNLDYLDDLADRSGKENSDYTPIFDLVQNNKVGSFLKNQGYFYIYAGGWWGPTQVNKQANKNINLYADSSEFLRKFLGMTILKPLIGEYYKGNQFFGFFQDRIYENTNYKFEKLNNIAQEKSPKFVFTHMLFPHHPYLFDKNCQRVDDKRDLPEKEKYLEQLICANSKIKKLIDAILARSEKPPIIIIQSDEGPYKADEMNLDGERSDWTKVSDEAVKTHMRILNAYYLPGFDYKKLYPSITPVNTFRLIFNYYFGTNLKNLPDKNYFIPNIDRPYNYFEITDTVRSD